MIDNHKSNENPIFQLMYSIILILSKNLSKIMEKVIAIKIEEALRGNVRVLYTFNNSKIDIGNIKYCNIIKEI